MSWLKEFFYVKYIMARAGRGITEPLMRKEGSHNLPLHIVLGGPSYTSTKEYITSIPGECMVVNYMASTEVLNELHPRYLVLADPEFVEGHKGTPYLIDLLKNHFIEVYLDGGLYDKTHDSIIKNSVTWVGGVALKRDYVGKIHKTLFEKNKIQPSAINVGIFAIYIAIQLGFKTIYIHGLDFDFLKTISVRGGQVFMDEACHSYDAEEKVKSQWWNMKQQYGWMYEAYQGFYNMAEYAKDEKVDVINMNINSFVDCFKYFNCESDVYTEGENR